MGSKKNEEIIDSEISGERMQETGTEEKKIPSMEEWLREAKQDPQSENVGMYLVHNGIVRKSAKSKVRGGDPAAADVVGMRFSYDRKKAEEAVEQTRALEGIYYVRIWLNSGELRVGDDLMYVLVGGDIRPHVIAALEFLVGKLKKECVTEEERYEDLNKDWNGDLNKVPNEDRKEARNKGLNQEWNKDRKEDRKEDLSGGSLSAARVGCVIMASGLSRRFGTNKLLATFRGKTFLETVLELTESVPFAKRAVVTRSEEVKQICEARGVEVIFHDLPGRNDAVRLGIEAMQEMDGCLFCPCDQPLLQAESLKRMIQMFDTEADSGRLLDKEDTRASAEEHPGIFRLSYQGSVGTPILFGKEFFEELSHLPEKCGGSYVAKQHPERVTCVEALQEMELYDVDTPEEYQKLNADAAKEPASTSRQ